MTFTKLFRLAPAAVAASTVALLTFAAAPAAMADGPTQVTVQASEYAYAPNAIQLVAGQPVQLTIVNTGQADHDIKSDMPISNLVYVKADNDAAEQADNAAQGTFDVDFDQGDTSTVTFVPTTPGTYAFKCDEPNHAEQGMTGTFTVVAGS